MIDLILWFYVGYKCEILTWWFVALLIIKGFISATKWSLMLMASSERTNNNVRHKQ